MKIAYTAFDKAGQMIKDIIDAADINDAKQILRGKGLLVSEIGASNGQSSSGVVRKSGGIQIKIGGRGKRLKNLALFTRQLHVLTSTGTPIIDALSALVRQTEVGAWRDILEKMHDDVEKGVSLSDAMKKHPRYFDSTYISLISSGEAGGQFCQMLERLTMLTSKQLSIYNKVSGAMVYPILLLVVAISVMISMMVIVLPTFADLFESLKVPLPATTEILMDISYIMRTQYLWLLIGLSSIIGSIVYYLKTPAGKKFTDQAMVTLPVVKKATRSFAMARITRILGTLLQSHVPLLEALNLTKHSCGNHLYVKLVEDSHEAVTQGNNISDIFADNPLVDPSVYEAVKNGESNGQIGPLLISIAEFLEEENDVVVKSLTSILEPIILLFMGVVVAIIAISMFLPLFDLTAMAGG